MISYLGDAVLFSALLLTSLQVLRMRGELRRMRAYHAEFQTIFGKTETALTSIQLTVHDLQVGGRDVIDELGLRIDAGRRLLGEIDAFRASSDFMPPGRRHEADAA